MSIQEAMLILAPYPHSPVCLLLRGTYNLVMYAHYGISKDAFRIRGGISRKMLIWGLLCVRTASWLQSVDSISNSNVIRLN